MTDQTQSPPPQQTLPRETLASLAAYSGDPWTPGNPYFAEAEKVGLWLWENVIWPFIGDSDFSARLYRITRHRRVRLRRDPRVGGEFLSCPGGTGT
jgi:hypothetical protein